MYKTVHKLIKKYKSSDPLTIAHCMNAKLIYQDFGDNIRGFYQYFKRGIIIGVNNTLPEKEMNRVIAHEIGHAILHKKLNRIFMDKFTLNAPGRYENEADLFAAYLIISDDDISEYISHEYTASQIADMTGIDEVFVKKRIEGYLKKFS